MIMTAVLDYQWRRLVLLILFSLSLANGGVLALLVYFLFYDILYYMLILRMAILRVAKLRFLSLSKSFSVIQVFPIM